MSFRKGLIKAAVFASLLFTLGTSMVYANSVALIDGENINIRRLANTEAEIVYTLSTGEELNLVNVEGDWVKIKLEDDSIAYVSKEFIKIKQVNAKISDDGVNVRKDSNKQGEIIGSVGSADSVVVLSKVDDFYEINFDNKNAYVHKDFVEGDLLGYVQLKSEIKELTKIEEKAVQYVEEKPAEKAVDNGVKEYVHVTSDNGINVRMLPDANGEIAVKAAFNEGLKLIEAGTEWHKVTYQGFTGYVSVEFTQLITSAEFKSLGGTRAKEIVSYAKQFLGTPYVWAGTNLNSGVDCSGFVYAVMRDSGITVNRSSRDQVNNGTNISKGELKVGDLVFFDTNGGKNNGNISHVGIYLGNSQFIHASSSRKTYCVTISSLNEDYYIRNYVAATRVIK